jgi:two-component system copper resistance phosphate regulon response regulator CusR
VVPSRLTVGALTIDQSAQRVWVGPREVTLTSREFALLAYLARRAGAVVGRAEIAEHVWDAQYDPLSNVVDVYVQRLRRKLDAPSAGAANSVIRTRRGDGYQLVSGEP